MKKILVVVSRVPYPLEKGDKLRAFNQIKVLSTRYEVELFALDDPSARSSTKAVEVLGEFCCNVEIVKLNWLSIYFNIFKAFFKGLPLQVGYFYSSKAQKKLKERIASFKPDHIYCQLVRTAEYVKDIEHIPLTLDYMDALSKGIERRIPKATFFLKVILELELKRLRAYEAEVFNRFVSTTIISEQDRGHIEHEDANAIRIVPNGVDTTFFSPSDTAEKKYDLMFAGNMSYPPNIEAAIYLATEVLPLIQTQRPETNLVIAGVSPVPQVKSLASEHVTVTGWVEDMRVCYAQSRVFIAPMHISIGMQNKILEAMAMELPCVCSVMANNAIGAEHGRNVLLGKNTAEYANSALKLLDNSDTAATLSKGGRDFVVSRYDWNTSSDELMRIFA